MATSSLLLCLSLLAVWTIGALALTPMEQRMNADIMADMLDLKRKIMKHQMLMASLRGGSGGNSMLPAAQIGLRDFLPSLQGMMSPGMFPALSPEAGASSGAGAVPTGTNTQEVSPSFQNLGITNSGKTSKQNKNDSSKKNTNSVQGMDTSSGTVSSPTPDAINTMISSSNNKFSMADLMKDGPLSMGTMSGGNNLKVVPENTDILKKDISGPSKGKSVKGQTPVNQIQSGPAKAALPFPNPGQAGMSTPQQMAAFQQFMLQEDICSETPSKARLPCVNSMTCAHKTQCFNGRCCAISHAHAEILDNMFDRPGF
ncbi:protein suppressor 2 of zeste-like [Argopecten irradians]|uniref:protein suppressor 2 of zeste-like n=1 Tax=Argopecten irradians TaxID=31199 RepID=UPI00371467F2